MPLQTLEEVVAIDLGNCDKGMNTGMVLKNLKHTVSENEYDAFDQFSG